MFLAPGFFAIAFMFCEIEILHSLTLLTSFIVPTEVRSSCVAGWTTRLATGTDAGISVEHVVDLRRLGILRDPRPVYAFNVTQSWIFLNPNTSAHDMCQTF